MSQTKHTTFYKETKGKRAGQQCAYTTIKHTPHHAMLRAEYAGTSYSHDDNAILYFVPGVALDRPMGKDVKRVY